MEKKLKVWMIDPINRTVSSKEVDKDSVVPYQCPHCGKELESYETQLCELCGWTADNILSSEEEDSFLSEPD